MISASGCRPWLKNVPCKLPIEGLWHGASSLSEKTTESNHLQLSLLRQNFLLRHLKTPSDGPAGLFEPATSRAVARCSTNWANRSTVNATAKGLESYVFGTIYVPIHHVPTANRVKANRSLDNKFSGFREPWLEWNSYPWHTPLNWIGLSLFWF